MTWGKPKRPPKGGWQTGRDEREPSWLRQVIHTVLEVVAGGVIRAGKTAYDDDAHAGFWLGVGPDKVARFSVGGPSRWFKWSGQDVEVRGRLLTPTVTVDDAGLAILGGEDGPNQLRFTAADGETLAAVECTDGPWLQLVTAQTEADGDVARIDLHVDGDFGGSVILRLETTKGGGSASAKLKVLIGLQTRLTVDANGVVKATGGFNASARSVMNVGDASAAGDALPLGQADGRYVAKAGGWSGNLRTDEIYTLTVVDGQITGVA